MSMFQIGELFSKFSELDSIVDVDKLVEVDAAIEEVNSTTEKLRGDLLSEGKAMKARDYDRLLEIVTDLREIFRHLEEHCREAEEALWQISDVVAGKAEIEDF